MGVVEDFLGLFFRVIFSYCQIINNFLADKEVANLHDFFSFKTVNSKVKRCIELCVFCFVQLIESKVTRTIACDKSSCLETNLFGYRRSNLLA